MESEILQSYMISIQDFNKKTEFYKNTEVIVFDNTDEDLIEYYLKSWKITKADTLINRADSTDINSPYILNKKLKKILIKELKKDEPIDWNNVQFPDNFRLVEYKKAPILENLKLSKRKISLLLSKPVIFQNGTMAIFRAWEIYGSNISGTPTLQFYKKKDSKWVKFSEIAWGSF
ncbi:hypothetical protein LY01_00008 [Nonlabens xylanidelens]|uniref:Uncharacterized protein n=1 Tax=Nonlabens xylanidelens TaxID=191564 RepID=A0A2S6IPK7_9FLAO|nr:hypothetical protein [Nonlabens xylanidelens]PPK96194.1 hypothetical protein LY01_00008 [Nonlabens xylanidelens]